MTTRRDDALNGPVRRWLDGELEFTDLPEEARAEAQAWGRLLSAVRDQHPAAPAPAWLEEAVMREIEALETPGAWSRFWKWLVQPRPVNVPPLAVGLGAAALAALMLIPPTVPSGAPVPGEEATATISSVEEPVLYVQFILEAPGARTVSVGGDFDAWEGSFALEDPDGDGMWTGRVPLEPGLHTYMFLVDGSEWITDPRAERYADDGFGNRNALLALTDPST
jgi:hypothetical protein